MSDDLVTVKNLSRYFTLDGRVLKAVDGVSFSIRRGETFGLVGESGCGKSTLGRTIIGLYEPTSGSVEFDGGPVNRQLSGQKRHGGRCLSLRHGGRCLSSMSRRMQMIFQDPYTSLNPRMKVMDIIAEGIDNHGMAASRAEREEMVVRLLRSVGLNEQHAGRYPHEFSGGQRQRVGIARALSVDPDFIIADEPISALDVSIQAQTVNLLKRLQKERGLTYLFIAHDLSMVRHISDRIGVMYLGGLAELADSEELFNNPLHPYTQALLSAIPLPDPRAERARTRSVLQGTASLDHDCPGCRFAPRCARRTEVCERERPEMREVSAGHFVSCFLHNQ